MTHSNLKQARQPSVAWVSRRLLAVVDWGAPGWAMRIAQSLDALISQEESPWIVRCLKPRAAKAALRRSLGDGRTQAACLVITRADPGEVRRAVTHFEPEIADQRAELVLVDCRLTDLPALCEAVRALPRWPIAWLGSVGDGSCDELVTKVKERILQANAVMYEAGV